ncbi:MAG: sulfotransferase domain-containing protein [Deltaproteobacteria bacterium]|nr:sulfotransferase domain-containing protein [Deltaproteobacteria bacterium]
MINILNYFKRLFFTRSDYADNFHIRESDVFIVSYPKSGNTWLRFLLCSYMLGEQCDFQKGRKLIPDIHADSKIANNLNSPRLLKSHSMFNDSYKKIIYLVRDGRDVAVSYYWHLIKFKVIPGTLKFSDFLEKFNKGEFGGKWSEHVISWIDSSTQKHVVRYEDLKSDPVNNLFKIIEFLNLDGDLKPDFNRIVQAVDNCSLDKMRSIERAQRDSIPTHKNSNFDIDFVRKGGVGDYQNYFSATLEENFIKLHGNSLKRFGYINNG